MAAIALSLVLALSSSSPAVPNDELGLLACAVETEAGRLGGLREEAGAWVAHVALNRARAGWWHDPDAAGGPLEQAIKDGFHGLHLCVGEEWAARVALDAVRSKDVTGGSMFVLSRDDLADLGPGGVPVRCFGDWPGLCFFKEWWWDD